MPRLDDDGSTVQLDLHGLRVDEALALCRRTLSLCLDRGRGTLVLIHGLSTSAGTHRNRTIKHDVHTWLSGAPPGVTDWLARDAEVVVALDLTRPSRPDRIRLLDVM